jgi:hypothetical protein
MIIMEGNHVTTGRIYYQAKRGIGRDTGSPEEMGEFTA